MCGIAGILQADPGAPVSREELQILMSRLAHRGPDGQGLWMQGPIGLAHTRLAMVDPAGGRQPIGNVDGSLQVICNGEIYNHHELRRQLQRRGHVFRTQSDTEVLLYLYEEHGPSLVHHLNGPFALALWDGRQQRLLLARDRVGMRPLFIARVGQALAFASEAKALLALPGCPRALDMEALAQTWTLWAPLAPRSAFAGIEALPPGCLELVGRDGRRERECWWEARFETDPALAARPFDDLAEELHGLLRQAVRLQLDADAEVGVALSGGLDSAALAALAGTAPGPSRRRSFSLAFEDPAYDESGPQQAVAKHLDSQLHRVLVRQDDVASDFPRAVFHAETALVRTAPGPLLRLAAATSQQGVKALLSGEGADELFAGYDLFKEAQLRRFMERQPGSEARGALLRRLYPWLPRGHTGAAALGGAGLRLDGPFSSEPGLAQRGRIRLGLRGLSLWHPDHRQGLLHPDPTALLLSQMPPGFSAWSPLSQDQALETHTLLSGYLLSTQGDRQAMAHGIELRHPFLDHHVMDFALRLPQAAKLRGLRDKRILRQAMRGHLPETLRLRPKQPYRAPESRSFFDEQGQLPDYARELLDPRHLRQTGLFDEAAVTRLVAKCRAGRAIGFADNQAFVAVLSTLLLQAQFVQGAAASWPDDARRPPGSRAARA